MLPFTINVQVKVTVMVAINLVTQYVILEIFTYRKTIATLTFATHQLVGK